MKKCHFLEVHRQQEGGRAYYCGAGVNFYLLGENRDRCRTCPLKDLGDAPLCEHLQVHTFLERDAERREFVHVRFDCGLLHESLDDLSACANCLHYQVARARAPSTLAFQAGSCQGVTV